MYTNLSLRKYLYMSAYIESKKSFLTLQNALKSKENALLIKEIGCVNYVNYIILNYFINKVNNRLIN